jgi:hypothetical protein
MPSLTTLAIAFDNRPECVLANRKIEAKVNRPTSTSQLRLMSSVICLGSRQGNRAKCSFPACMPICHFPTSRLFVSIQILPRSHGVAHIVPRPHEMAASQRLTAEESIAFRPYATCHSRKQLSMSTEIELSNLECIVEVNSLQCYKCLLLSSLLSDLWRMVGRCLADHGR